MGKLLQQANVAADEIGVWLKALNYSMIRKSGNRFSEKIMLQQEDEIMIRFNLIGS